MKRKRFILLPLLNPEQNGWLNVIFSRELEKVLLITPKMKKHQEIDEGIEICNQKDIYFRTKHQGFFLNKIS